MNEKEFYIIMGRSGSGKGTQSELLKSFLEKGIQANVNKKFLHITTGVGFREFIEGDSASAVISKKITNAGGLNPEFLAIWNWSNIFINNLSGDESVILDGAPRKEVELKALESAIDFYGYKKVTVIYINVRKEWAIDRLISRGRSDDNQKEEQDKKMKWFEEDVFPCINLYKQSDKNNFIEINGEQSIENVQKEIIEKLN